MLNFVDNNFQFRYVEFQTLEFDPSAHRANLISVLAYYVYIMLGVDYDSFSPLGGTEFFQMAEKIVKQCPECSRTRAGNPMMDRETGTGTGL